MPASPERGRAATQGKRSLQHRGQLREQRRKPGLGEQKMTQPAPSSGMAFKPGESVPISGIYHIEHSRPHRQSHEVVFAKSDRFPACEICEHQVRYTLLRAAPFVFEDPDFREPERQQEERESSGT